MLRFQVFLEILFEEIIGIIFEVKENTYRKRFIVLFALITTYILFFCEVYFTTFYRFTLSFEELTSHRNLEGKRGIFIHNK
jgi:hypothetical protein